MYCVIGNGIEVRFQTLFWVASSETLVNLPLHEKNSEKLMLIRANASFPLSFFCRGRGQSPSAALASLSKVQDFICPTFHARRQSRPNELSTTPRYSGLSRERHQFWATESSPFPDDVTFERLIYPLEFFRPQRGRTLNELGNQFQDSKRQN